MSWLAKLLGFSSLSDPRGVRADFCDYCLTISPHWAYDRAAALIQQAGTDPLRGAGDSFQLCQICCSKSPLPEGSILMPQRAAASAEIEQLIDQTNPGLYDESETERIAQQLSVMQSPAERKQLALQAFARSQEDLANDTFRLADVRIWGGIGLILYFGLKALRRVPRLAIVLFSLLVPALILYRFYFVPRLVRTNQRPAWIRLLTGTAISFGVLIVKSSRVLPGCCVRGSTGPWVMMGCCIATRWHCSPVGIFCLPAGHYFVKDAAGHPLASRVNRVYLPVTFPMKLAG